MSVPAAATIYAQVVGSEALWNMHQLNPQQVIKDSNLPFDISDSRRDKSYYLA